MGSFFEEELDEEVGKRLREELGLYTPRPSGGEGGYGEWRIRVMGLPSKEEWGSHA